MLCNRIAKTTQERCRNKAKQNSSWCGKCKGLAKPLTKPTINIDKKIVNVFPDNLEEVTADMFPNEESFFNFEIFKYFPKDMSNEEIVNNIYHLADVLNESVNVASLKKKPEIMYLASEIVSDMLEIVAEQVAEENDYELDLNRSITNVSIADKDDVMYKYEYEEEGEIVSFSSYSSPREFEAQIADGVLTYSTICFEGQIKIENEKGNCVYLEDDSMWKEVIEFLS